MLTRSVLRAALIAGLGLLLADASFLQAQIRPERLRGRVTNTAGGPVVDAAVTAVMAPDRAAFQTRTDSAGNYDLRVAAGTGDYLLHVTRIGFVAFRKRITRAGADSVFVTNVTLAPVVQRLDALRVQAQKPKPSRSVEPGPETGASEKITDGFQGALTPDVAGDLSAIAATLPGVTPVGGGISVLGLDPSQNSTTINGLAFGGSGFPRAAPANVRVATTTYDPARGWFSGAQTNIELGSGSVFSGRRATVTLDAPALQYTDRVSSRLGQRYSNVNASVGGSGPIDNEDRFFYSFGIQGGHRVADASSLVSADADLLRHAGVAADSIVRLLSVLRSAGIPTALTAVPTALTTDRALVLARLDRSPYDWKTLQASKSTTGITLIGDWTRQQPLNLSPTATPTHTGERNQLNLGAQGLYSRFFASDYLTTTRTSVSYATTRTSPYLPLPSADVLVASAFDDGSGGVSTLAFGGSPDADGTTRRLTWETTHETQFYAQSRRSLHRFKLSADARFDAYRDDLDANRRGTFVYQSIGDIDANRPASFTRTLISTRREGGEWNAFAAVGDLWRATPALQLQYGLRLEGNRFTSGPTTNPAVASAFGVANDQALNTVHVSPRAGFTWVRAGAGNNGAITFNPLGSFHMAPTSYLRGGIGEFRSMLSPTLLSDASVRTGLPGTESTLVCAGSAVPVPHWTDYLADASTIPSACATTDGFAQTAPSVRLFDRSFDAPRSWRANLSYASQFRRLVYSIDGTYSLNLYQPSFIDLNASRAVAFTTADEGRSVFVPTSAIVPSTGVIARRASRAVGAFDQVLEQQSNGRSVSRQLILTASPDLYQVTNWWVSTSYVLADVRAFDNGFGSTTFASPFAREWHRGSLDARHGFILQGGYSLGGLTVSAFSRVSSGLPFTPIVNTDVNGDGFSNDRAFIFDPATAESRTGAGMRSLLATASSRIRGCLEREMGRVAGAQSCEGPWTATMNAAVTAQSSLIHVKRIAQIQLALANPLAGLDLALHGSDRLRGWGVPSVPDPVLYELRGFDPVARRMLYDVNPRFGNTDPARSTLRAPFRMTLDVSVNLGRDPGLQQLERYLRPGRSGHSGTRLTVDELKRRYERNVADPYVSILAESDSLFLTPAQQAAIQQLAARYRQRMDSLWLSLATDFAALGDSYDVRAALARQEDATADAREITRLNLRAYLPTVLTPMQLAVLPSGPANYYRATKPIVPTGRTLRP